MLLVGLVNSRLFAGEIPPLAEPSDVETFFGAISLVKSLPTNLTEEEVASTSGSVIASSTVMGAPQIQISESMPIMRSQNFLTTDLGMNYLI